MSASFALESPLFLPRQSLMVCCALFEVILCSAYTAVFLCSGRASLSWAAVVSPVWAGMVLLGLIAAAAPSQSQALKVLSCAFNVVSQAFLSMAVVYFRLCAHAAQLVGSWTLPLSVCFSVRADHNSISIEASFTPMWIALGYDQMLLSSMTCLLP